MGESVLTAIETVWEHIKAAAEDYAKRGTRLGISDAESIILTFLRDERVTPWAPADVIEFYANELLALIERDRFTVQ